MADSDGEISGILVSPIPFPSLLSALTLKTNNLTIILVMTSWRPAAFKI